MSAGAVSVTDDDDVNEDCDSVDDSRSHARHCVHNDSNRYGDVGGDRCSDVGCELAKRTLPFRLAEL